MTLIILLVFAALGVANLWLGYYRLTSEEPGITGIRSRPLRWLAWALSGADIKADGTPRRVALPGAAAGSLHLLLGCAFLAVVVVALVG